MCQPTSERPLVSGFTRHKAGILTRQGFLCLVLSIAILAAKPGIGICDEDKAVPPELPILVMSTKSFSQKAVSDYMKQMSRELKIGESMIQQVEDSMERVGTTEIERPIMGGMLFLGRGFIPIPQWISFSEIKDQAEFRRLVQKRKSMFGETAELETLGDGNQYKLSMTSSYLTPYVDPESLPETSDGEVTSVQVTVGGPSSGVSVLDGNEGEIIEQGGRKLRRISNTFYQYFRYHDGLMYESQEEGLLDIALPTRRLVGLDTELHDDFSLEFHPDRVPKGFKDLFWNTVRSTASPQLQQFDNEPDRTYAARRSGGDLALSAIQSVIYDIDRGDIHLQLIRDNQPIQASLHLRARKKSKLTAALPPLTQFRSRFAALRNDGAAVTIHSGVQLPKDATDAIRALSDVARNEFGEVVGGDHAATIADSLQLIADSGSIEVLIKLNHTDESDGVIYGGVQIQDNPKLLGFLESVLKDQNASISNSVRLRDLDGRRFLQFDIPEYAELQDKEKTGVHLTHLWICQGADCLWFALGSENAYKMLSMSINRAESATGLRMTPPLFTVELDLDRWLDYPRDDPTGLGGLPRWVDEKGAALIPFRPMGPNMEQLTSTPLLDRVLALGGEARFLATVRANEQGVFADVSIGPAIARYYVARILDMTDSIMRMQMQQVEEAQRRAEEAAAKAAEQSRD